MKKFYYDQAGNSYELIGEGKQRGISGGKLDSQEYPSMILKNINTGEILSYPAFVFKSTFSPYFNELSSTTIEEKTKIVLDLLGNMKELDIGELLKDFKSVMHLTDLAVQNYLDKWYKDADVHPDLKKELKSFGAEFIIMFFVLKSKTEKKESDEK